MKTPDPTPGTPPRPMLVVSYVAALLRVPLRVALGTAHRLVEAATWPEVADFGRRLPVDLLVVDPVAEGEANTEAIPALLAQCPETPLVVYTTMEPPAMKAVARLTHQGIQALVLHRFDDSPERFRDTLERVVYLPPPPPRMSVADQIKELQALEDLEGTDDSIPIAFN